MLPIVNGMVRRQTAGVEIRRMKSKAQAVIALMTHYVCPITH